MAKYKAEDTIKYSIGREVDQVVYTIIMVLKDKYLVRTPTGQLWEVKFETFDSKTYDTYTVGQ